MNRPNALRMKAHDGAWRERVREGRRGERGEETGRRRKDGNTEGMNRKEGKKKRETGSRERERVPIERERGLRETEGTD